MLWLAFCASFTSFLRALDAITGRNHGLLDDHRKGVHGAGFVFHEHHLLPLGLLVNELDGVFEPAQKFRRETAESVDGYALGTMSNVVGGLLGVRLLCAFTKWVGTTVLKVAGVLHTASRLLPQDIQALVVDVCHAPVPQLSGLRFKARPSGARSRTISPPAPALCLP